MVFMFFYGVRGSLMVDLQLLLFAFGQLMG